MKPYDEEWATIVNLPVNRFQVSNDPAEWLGCVGCRGTGWNRWPAFAGGAGRRGYYRAGRRLSYDYAHSQFRDRWPCDACGGRGAFLLTDLKTLSPAAGQK